MPLVRIINRSVFKSLVFVRCLSCYSSNFKCSSEPIVNREHLLLAKKLPIITSSTSLQRRFKYDKHSNKKDEDEDDDSTESEFYDKGDKVATIKVTSLRMDLIVKSGLQLARNKIETAFFDSRIRVNGKKVAKKSITLHIGDEVDVIKGFSPLNKEHLIVSRLEILGATPNEEDISVSLRRYKNLTIENYSGQNAYKAIFVEGN